MPDIMKTIIGLLILCAVVTVISVTALLIALGYAERLDKEIEDESSTEKQ